MTVEETLKQRDEIYGDFSQVAKISQCLKLALATKGIATRSYSQQEALELIATKLARIVCGDPNYVDSWRDLAGYATLIADKLEKNA